MPDGYPLGDYRAVLGGLFRGVWGLSTPQLERVFPGSEATDLRIV